MVTQDYMSKKAQIIVKSCNRRDLELEQVKNFLRGNGYFLEEIETRQFSNLRGYQISKKADLILFSTCAFSSVSEGYSIEDLELIQRNKKPSAELVVCGCLPEINPDSLSAIFDGPTFGPRSYEKLNDIIKPEKEYQKFSHQNITTSYGKDHFTIQIQKGCPSNCSYCAIKFAIGSLESVPIDDVINEFHKGLDQGYKQFNFLGDCSSGYGLDNKETLGTLLKRIMEIDRDFSLTLTDIAPFHLPLCFNEIKNLCAENKITSLYIATQSANPRILKLMRRSFDMGRVKEMLVELRDKNPSLNLISSIIVGFPSETMKELDDTVEFCNKVSFNQLYCHGYSARPNTDSSKLPGQLTTEEIRERCLLVKSRLGNMVTLATIPGTGAKRYWTVAGFGRLLKSLIVKMQVTPVGFLHRFRRDELPN